MGMAQIHIGSQLTPTVWKTFLTHGKGKCEFLGNTEKIKRIRLIWSVLLKYNIYLALQLTPSTRKRSPQLLLKASWQREKDSNPHIRSQSPLCYHYTIPLCSWRTNLIIQIWLDLSTPICRQFEEIFWQLCPGPWNRAAICSRKEAQFSARRSSASKYFFSGFFSSKISTMQMIIHSAT